MSLRKILHAAGILPVRITGYAEVSYLVAELAVFLASKAVGYITAQVISIDGGVI